jgi:hypothetical protein
MGRIVFRHRPSGRGQGRRRGAQWVSAFSVAEQASSAARSAAANEVACSPIFLFYNKKMDFALAVESRMIYLSYSSLLLLQTARICRCKF